MKRKIPRILLAGTNSGCGKTTVTCTVMQALVNRGIKVGSFKCGPDYIDPMFHSRVIGAKSANLDPFFFRENTLRYLLAKNAAPCDVSIIEGVMGYYDGMGLTTTRASSYEAAQVTGSPVILVVSAKGASLSVLAAIQGFLTFNPDNNIKGVILNQCSAMTYGALRKAMEERFAIKPLGFLPKMADCALESRHLGLVTAAEVENLKEKLQMMAQQAEKTVDMDGLLALTQSADPVSYEPVELPWQERVRIAVARDNAFCFYYEDSLEAMTEMGAELVDFSPLNDEKLPENIHGLYLGGGYPELHAEKLGKNKAMLGSIYAALENGLPCIAECGGFMYLTEAIGEYPMVGFLPGKCFDNGKLTRFGYVTLRAKEDNLLCKAGEEVPGHEFHHWDCTQPGDRFTATRSTGKSWDCAVVTDRLRRANGAEFVLLTPGNYGSDFIHNELGLDMKISVQVSNFIGDALDICKELGFKGALLIGHVGKLVKIAGGMMNTHSKYGDCRMDILAAHAGAAGVPAETVQEILTCVACDDVLRILQETDYYEKTLSRVTNRVAFHLQHRGDGVETGTLLFSKEYGILGKSDNADELLTFITEE